MKVFASLVVALAVIFSAPASNAIDLPKPGGHMSLVDHAQTKKRFSRSRREQCVTTCVNEGWGFNLEATCRCHCYTPKRDCPPLW